MPIISGGDMTGCVASVYPAGSEHQNPVTPELEAKLIQTAATFLGRQLED